MKKILEKDIRKVLSKEKHPEINSSLIELGIIKNINIKNDLVLVVLAFPFLGIPIKEDLINIVKKSIWSLNKDIKVKTKIVEMNEEEKNKFMEKAKEGWKF
ncbi:MAG: DUF59 domain-containing protein [Xanthomonadaceae bacterium]|nr:DUF59 domain-containing protein [Rhodospirillaceae bacterium]NIA18244.1 DUF59 domain-containing protein [Xanthomonadaceae bacterium]